MSSFPSSSPLLLEDEDEEAPQLDQSPRHHQRVIIQEQCTDDEAGVAELEEERIGNEANGALEDRVTDEEESEEEVEHKPVSKMLSIGSIQFNNAMSSIDLLREVGTPLFIVILIILINFRRHL